MCQRCTSRVLYHRQQPLSSKRIQTKITPTTTWLPKEELADFKVAIADAILTLTNSNVAANARMDKFETELHEIRDILQDLHASVRNLIETNRRAIRFTASEE